MNEIFDNFELQSLCFYHVTSKNILKYSLLICTIIVYFCNLWMRCISKLFVSKIVTWMQFLISDKLYSYNMLKYSIFTDIIIMYCKLRIFNNLSSFFLLLCSYFIFWKRSLENTLEKIFFLQKINIFPEKIYYVDIMAGKEESL